MTTTTAPVLCPICAVPVRLGHTLCVACNAPVPPDMIEALFRRAADEEQGLRGSLDPTDHDGELAPSEASDDDIVESTADMHIPRPLSQDRATRVWHDAAMQRAAASLHTDANANATSRRRLPLLVGLAVAAIAVIGLVVRINGAGQSGVAIDATTPASALPWRTYQSPSQSFRIDMPGRVDVTAVGSDETDYVTTLPGSTVTVRALAAPSMIDPVAAARQIASNLAATEGLDTQAPQVVAMPYGKVVRATLVRGGASVAHIGVLARADGVWVIDVREPSLTPRADELFDRALSSFRPLG